MGIYGKEAKDISLGEIFASEDGKVKDAIYIKASLLNHDEQIGTIVLFAPKGKYNTLNSSFQKLLYCITAFLIGLNLYLISIFYRVQVHVLHPLKFLHQEIQRLLVGDTNPPLHYDYDNEIGAICHDVELVRGELSFEKKQSAKMSENEKNLLACISHDMKTPLFAISSHIEAIRDGIVSEQEEINEYADVILSRVKVMEKLIEDILEHSQTQLQELSIKLQSCYAKPYFKELFQKIEQDFECHGNKVYLSEIPECSLSLDPFRIQQVVFNISSNALKYSEYKTDLYVECEIAKINEKEYFVMSMRDEGKGISASDLPFVFERFYRGEKARSSKIAGSGLGLNISKYIIEKHGGWIACDSVFGQGTTVSFALPV